MKAWLDISPWLIPMAALLVGSAFFSASEAALFYLTPQDRRQLARGNAAQKAAARLLQDPDRLLTAVLFWNFVLNMVYFTIISIVGFTLESKGHAAEASLAAVVALMVIIVCSELLPKSLAVLRPRWLAALTSVPLSGLISLVDPLLPAFRTMSLLSRRLFWPSFQTEPFLQVRDLERAVQLSSTDARLLTHEQNVLQNIVALSSMRADELMRPRRQIRTFTPPVSLDDLRGEVTPSGYLFITEPESDEVVAAVTLGELTEPPRDHLERWAHPVLYVPWSAPVATALELMLQRGRQVAAVVNEYGETIGMLTYDDLLDTVFSPTPGRSERLFQRVPIRKLGGDAWQVIGMTSVRRLARHFQVELPESKSVTMAGVVQETLEGFPVVGDQCRWGPFELKVVDVKPQGEMLLEVRLAVGRDEEDAS